MRVFDNYHEYELVLARNILVPFLKQRGVSLDGKRVLDVGCGEGGTLRGLAEQYSFEGLGIDQDAGMVSRCPAVRSVTFTEGDFFSHSFEGPYDFIILRDVLEHCGNCGAMLDKTASLLSTGGAAYVTYTPFLSPFGGHQHNGSSVFSNVPYLHFLPKGLFDRLIRPQGNLYKSFPSLLSDIDSVFKTRLMTGDVKTACRKTGLAVSFSRHYLIRPDYRYKFGLPGVPFPGCFPLTSALDPFCTSVEMILEKRRHNDGNAGEVCQDRGAL